MITLTTSQAQAIIAFMEAFDLCTTGAWTPIERMMQDDFGIEDPEQELEEAKAALENRAS